MKLMNHNSLAIAILTVLVFSAELTIMGYTKFIGVLSGTGETYIDFPNNFIRWRINFEFIVLNIKYYLCILDSTKVSKS